MNSNKEITYEDYKRAEKFLAWNAYKMAFNTHIQPNWIGKSDRFWYVSKDQNEKRFYIVDPERKTKEDAFDHDKLAKSLSTLKGKSYSREDLPFEDIKFIEDENTIQFDIRKQRFLFDLEPYQCKEKTKKVFETPTELKSPDGKWVAFIKNYNVFIRSLSDGQETQLTHDGEKHNDYGTLPESSTYEITIRRLGIGALLPPIMLWSPDSKKLLVHKLDQRRVKNMYLIQSAGLGKNSRPILHKYRYPLPGDYEVAQADLVILDIEKKSKVVVKYKPQTVAFMPPIFMKFVWWREDSKIAYFLYIERDIKTARLCEFNAISGDSRTIIEENASTYIEFNHIIREPPNVKVVSNGNEIIWFSQRDGWGHLYLYDGKTGKFKNQITSGQWMVHNIKHVDEKNRWVYFIAGGKEETRDPYYGHLYRAKFDGTDIQLLTPENANHDVIFSPSGDYFVDNFSRVDTAPISVLRAVDGQLIQELESADISLLFKQGWIPPKPFKAKARDGITDLYGLIFYPSTFDPSVKYPILDNIYPGPQVIRTPKLFPQKLDNGVMGFWSPQSIAELGFIVITIDGMGTPLRSKAFHDYGYGNMGDAGGLEDHITAIQQLASEHPYMDLNRVGIYGHSGGGFASATAILSFPDFYKVAVSSAGNYDQRGYVSDWGEKYQGMLEGDNYKNQVTARLAQNLKGKLFLASGDMDDNVHPSLTLQLADALMKANKDFDMLMLPNRNHLFVYDEYFIRKQWDYFVRHLLNQEPPKEYKIKGPSMEFLMKMLPL